MRVACVQRWRDRQPRYRPLGEPIDPRCFEVARLRGDADAKAFVVRHHYSASYPAARVRFGLFQHAELVGVAVFSVPANPRSLDVLPGEGATKLELGRFVLRDEVPANGESWFLARCFEDLRREGFTGVVSFSDPVARSDADGRFVFPGHLGVIYQATNAVYLGRTRAERRRLLPDGTVLHGRALAKIRGREQGWRYAAALLERHGAAQLDEHEDAVTWLSCWLPRLTRSLEHGGNHKYAWGLRGRDRKRLPVGQPYPKVLVAQPSERPRPGPRACPRRSQKSKVRCR